MNTLKNQNIVKNTRAKEVKSVPFKETFVDTRGYGMRQIRQALKDLERGIFTF